jgi:transcriptional regulator with XRE-family HTH domain
MTPLREAMFNAGVTQEAAARAVGVRSNTVYMWASGKKPLPADRATQFATLLGVDKEVFAEMLSGRAIGSPVKLQTPVTMLDWLVQNVYIDLSPANYRPVLDKLAAAAGVSIFEVLDWVRGEQKIPARAVRAWADIWPGFNPAVLAYEVDYRGDDPAAERRQLVADLADLREESSTYEEARMRLAWFAEQFDDRAQNVEEVRRALDNGRGYPATLTLRAQQFAGRS